MSGNSIIPYRSQTKSVIKMILRHYFPVLPPTKHLTNLEYPKSQPGRTEFESIVTHNVIEPELFSGKYEEKFGKEELEAIKMPGFIHPDTSIEVGHFTQKAAEEIEELKKKPDHKPDMKNIEKNETDHNRN